jgi:rRNA small subunit pseudouridine methyltransferase Nep1
MLTLVLAEAELELVPPELVHHPAVIGHARQRGKEPARILLDSNYHHAAMTRLPEGRRRGRPDMAHLFLLTALESVANKQGTLKVIIHTRNDEMITVHPETRIMRSYERFLGLMEQLFETGAVPDEKHPLLALHQHMPLPRIVEETDADLVIAFSKTGTPTNLTDFFKKHSEKNIVCLIGGFPSGSFHTDIKTIATDILSLYPEMLPVWTVTGEILVNYENASR